MKIIMKASFLFISLFFAITNSNATELTEIRDLYESTFSRNNSYCRHNNKNFELQIRSVDKYSQPNDIDYGEYPFIIIDNIQYKVNFNHDIGRYRFIYGREKECSKTLTLPLNKEEMTLFFAQDNRPSPDLLVVVHLNPNIPKARILHTNDPILTYIQLKDRVLFLSYIPKTDLSTTHFNGNSYHHMNTVLPLWKQYKDEVISVDPFYTFNEFEWKNYFSDFEEFKKQFEWDSNTKTFKKNSYEVIFNTTIKKRCLSIQQEWRCRDF